MTIINQPWIKTVTGVMLALSLTSNAYTTTNTMPAFTGFDEKNIALDKAIMSESAQFAVNLALKTWAPNVYEVLQDIKRNYLWQAQYQLLFQAVNEISAVNHKFNRPHSTDLSIQPYADSVSVKAQILNYLSSLSDHYPFMTLTIEQESICVRIKPSELSIDNINNPTVLDQKISQSTDSNVATPSESLETALQQFLIQSAMHEVETPKST